MTAMMILAHFQEACFLLLLALQMPRGNCSIVHLPISLRYYFIHYMLYAAYCT